MRYQLNFKNDGGLVIATEILDAANDKDAIEQAHQAYEHTTGMRFEIRNGDRLVYIATKSWSHVVRPVYRTA
jgi:hypothetical protein